MYVWIAALMLSSSPEAAPARLDRIRVRAEPGIAASVTRLDGDDKSLKMIHFENGEPIARKALFFITGGKPDCSLATKLGCQLTPKGFVRTVGNEETNVPGLFVAGDASQGDGAPRRGRSR